MTTQLERDLQASLDTLATQQSKSPLSIQKAAHEPSALQLAITPAEAKFRLAELQAFVKSVMIEGEDFGTIPGTPKPTLYQPGAQKLAEVYALGWRFEDVRTVEDFEKPFFFYRRRCVIFSRRTGDVIGEAIGSCNSGEERYAGRWVYGNQVPPDLDIAKLKKQTRKSKNGKPYDVYRVPNPDILSLVNTIDKMASKRAFVGAVIAATRSSALFTQDLEDLPQEAFGEREDRSKMSNISPHAIDGEPEDFRGDSGLYASLMAALRDAEARAGKKQLSQASFDDLAKRVADASGWQKNGQSDLDQEQRRECNALVQRIKRLMSPERVAQPEQGDEELFARLTAELVDLKMAAERAQTHELKALRLICGTMSSPSELTKRLGEAKAKLVTSQRAALTKIWKAVDNELRSKELAAEKDVLASFQDPEDDEGEES